MKLLAFCVFDTATKAFDRPMFLMSEGHANRVWADEVNRKDDTNQYYRHPEDFLLYRVGSFDTDTGRLEMMEPSCFLSAKDVFFVKEIVN